LELATSANNRGAKETCPQKKGATGEGNGQRVRNAILVAGIRFGPEIKPKGKDFLNNPETK